MPQRLIPLLLVALSWPVMAQVPADPFPIAGRIVRFGYDLNYPTIQGDLINLTGAATGAQNNGVIVALPARAVQLDCTAGVYRLEVWSPPAAAWKPTVWSVAHTAYYPDDHFGHGWLIPSCVPQSAADVIQFAPTGTELGILRCHGYDGVLAVPGDLQAGSNNGVLFSLWMRHAHLIKSARVYHGEVWLGSFGWNEAVYSVDLCDYDPQ